MSDERTPVNTDPFISKVSLGNFKSVVDQVVDLARLTLLVGENSSGKSSILQGLRLLQQGIQSKSVGDRFPLNGDLLRMGTIDEIRTARKDLEKDTVSIGVEMVSDPRNLRSRIRRPPARIKWSIELSGTAPDEPGSTYLKSFNLIRYNNQHQLQLSLHISRRGSKAKIESIYYKNIPSNFRWFVSLSRVIEADLSFKGTLEDNSPKSTQISGVALMDSLPVYITKKRLTRRVLAEEWFSQTIEENTKDRPKLSRDRVSESIEISDRVHLVEVAIEHINTIIRQSGSKVNPDDLLSLIPRIENKLLREMGTLKSQEKTIKEISKGLKIDSQIDVIENDNFARTEPGITLIRDIIGKMRYLGPLREEPQFVMLTSPTASTGYIGDKGEFTAAVLYNHLHGKQERKYPLPNNIEEKNLNLVEAVKSWASYLGLVEDVSIEDLAALGLTIKVKSQGVESELPLPSVGVGVSQVLPVVVLCLLAEPGSVILLEQPELHLHPGLQQRLADFFIAVAESGRQLIVETHSEYFVSRLRRRVVEDSDDELLKLVKIVSAERDRETGETTYRDIDLTQYGEIQDWPKGFFDQAAVDEREIIRGALLKRKARSPSR